MKEALDAVESGDIKAVKDLASSWGIALTDVQANELLQGYQANLDKSILPGEPSRLT